jgi:hypothetical protein
MLPSRVVKLMAPEGGKITAYHTSGDPGNAQGASPPLAGSG